MWCVPSLDAIACGSKLLKYTLSLLLCWHIVCAVRWFLRCSLNCNIYGVEKLYACIMFRLQTLGGWFLLGSSCTVGCLLSSWNVLVWYSPVASWCCNRLSDLAFWNLFCDLWPGVVRDLRYVVYVWKHSILLVLRPWYLSISWYFTKKRLGTYKNPMF